MSKKNRFSDDEKRKFLQELAELLQTSAEDHFKDVLEGPVEVDVKTLPKEKKPGTG